MHLHASIVAKRDVYDPRPTTDRTVFDVVLNRASPNIDTDHHGLATMRTHDFRFGVEHDIEIVIRHDWRILLTFMGSRPPLKAERLGTLDTLAGPLPPHHRPMSRSRTRSLATTSPRNARPRRACPTPDRA